MVGVAMLIIASMLWSLSGVALKTSHMPPVAFAFWRSLAAGLCLLPLLPFSRGAHPQASTMSLAIVLHTAVVTLLLFAMTASTAAAGIILQYTGPVFCALFAWMFQRRAIGPRTATALVIATIGVAIMLIGGMKGGVNLVGPITGALSGIAFGGLILTLEIVNHRNDGRIVNPIAIVAINNLGTALILLPIAVGVHQLGATGMQFAIVGATGVIQLALPYLLFVLALRRVEPVDASLLILLEPVLNPVWVWLKIGEQPDIATFIGGGAILVAMIIEATKPPRPSAVPTASSRAGVTV